MTVRMAHRLGLHQEATLHRATIFEAELRRRLWWQIIALEFHYAQRAGVVTFSPSSWDTHVPLNINDEELNPEMSEAPIEHVGITEMCLTLMICEATNFVLRTPAICGNPQYFTNPDVPVSEKEGLINGFKDILDKRFVQYLDPAIPFHAMCHAAVLSITTRMYLMSLHPRQYNSHSGSRGGGDVNISQTSTEKLFSLTLAHTTCENSLRSNKLLEKFNWHFNMHFQSDSFIYLIHHLQTECVGPNADMAWP